MKMKELSIEMANLKRHNNACESEIDRLNGVVKKLKKRRKYYRDKLAVKKALFSSSVEKSEKLYAQNDKLCERIAEVRIMAQAHKGDSNVFQSELIDSRSLVEDLSGAIEVMHDVFTEKLEKANIASNLFMEGLHKALYGSKS